MRKFIIALVCGYLLLPCDVMAAGWVETQPTCAEASVATCLPTQRNADRCKQICSNDYLATSTSFLPVGNKYPTIVVLGCKDGFEPGGQLIATSLHDEQYYLECVEKKEVKCDGQPVRTQQTVDCSPTSFFAGPFDSPNLAHATKCQRTCNEAGTWVWKITQCENPYKPSKTGYGECERVQSTSANTVTSTHTQRRRTTAATVTPVNNAEAPAFTCDATIMTDINKWATDCADNTDIVTLIAEIRTYCTTDASRTEVGFSGLYARLVALNPQRCVAVTEETQLCESVQGATMVNGECKCTLADRVLDRVQKACVETAEARARREAEAAAARQRASETNINAISQKMDAISNAFGASVWKDKEGNFNTARLASDSIAGVVLGTAGGLITSNVVKKNQIKGGFEDIGCIIGGQVVASYGDDFIVGVNTNAQ